jgi:hypothetical protein
MPHEGPIRGDASFDPEKYLEELGIQPGEFYEVERQDGTKARVRFQLRTLGVSRGIVVEFENGTTTTITSIDMLNLKSGSEIKILDAEGKRKFLEELQKRHEDSSWSG